MRFRASRLCLLPGLLLITLTSATTLLGQATRQSPSSQEQRTARYIESVRQQPSLLLAVLRAMPKGGDLHNHLFGAIYAESFIDYAAADGLCVDRITSQLIVGRCEPCDKYTNKPAVKCAYADHVLYNSMLDAYSMRNWSHGEESGHDHFFASFDKFGPATAGRIGDMLAEAASRAAADHLQYLELMHTADGMNAAALGAKNGWNSDFATLRQQFLDGGLRDIVASTRQTLDADEKRRAELLHCETPQADAGCGVTTRYLYQVLRGLPKEQVFAQILLGFELAKADPRFVGLNLVMPEDWYVPMHDFPLHMKMLGFLREQYPGVHLSLHAGELAMGLVPPEGLRFHIRDSIEIAHAERIGHGVDVTREDNAVGLLKEMAEKNVLVEICLTSNDVILGVKGAQHPLHAYRKYGVPVALATDDEGVSRADMTAEYVRAVEDQGLTYGELKAMARNSLEHSFLSGKSLWANGKSFQSASGCGKDAASAAHISAGCEAFLKQNDKAATQWQLERAFSEFEKSF